VSENNNQVKPLAPDLQPTQDEEFWKSKKLRRTRLSIVLIGIVILILVSVGFVVSSDLAQGQNALASLSADSNTLYLANWSKGLDNWSGGPGWQWKQSGMINSNNLMGSTTNPPAFVLLAPYQPTSSAFQVTASIMDANATIYTTAHFGVVIGVNKSYDGYFCGLGQDGIGIDALSGGTDHKVIVGQTNADGIDTSSPQYDVYTVQVRKNVITFFFDGQQEAQITVSTNLVGASIGLYADSGVDVQGFRVEKLT
jgi:hypothetical protein